MMKKEIRRLTLVLLALALALTPTACAQSEQQPRSGGEGGEQAGYEPVTIESCGRETTFQKPPERAIANDINVVEMVLSLGVADRMVGVTGVDGKGEVLPGLRDELERVPILTREYLTGMETILGADADFVAAGWNYGFTEESGVTPEALAEFGIDSYAIRESCIRVGPRPDVSIEDTYADSMNLGRIFGVGDRAERLVEGYEDQVAGVRSRLPENAEPLRVFVYDSGEQTPLTAAGEAMPNALIGLAGGENVFGSVEDSWTTVGWEEVVERDPEFIVVVDYGEPSAEGKISFLKNNPALKDVESIREENFVVLSYAEATPSVRNVAAVEKLAAAFYPDAFESGGGE